MNEMWDSMLSGIWRFGHIMTEIRCVWNWNVLGWLSGGGDDVGSLLRYKFNVKPFPKGLPSLGHGGDVLPMKLHLYCDPLAVRPPCTIHQALTTNIRLLSRAVQYWEEEGSYGPKVLRHCENDQCVAGFGCTLTLS